MGHDHSHHHSHQIELKKVERLSPTQVRLELAFSADSVKGHFAETTKRYASQAKLPGFRPGKAPTQMIKSKFREEIQRDVVSHLLEAGLGEACQQAKLVPLNRPKFSLQNTDSVAEDKALEFTAEFEVQPEIDLRNYRGVPLKDAGALVTPEEINQTLESLRDRFATMEPAEGDKPVKGQFAVIEVGYHLVDDVEKKEAPQQFTVEVGKGLVFADIENALPEMTLGQERQIESTFPDDYRETDVAGKKALFTVKLIELKKKTLPELDDAFAAGIKPEATIETLKTDIEKSIRETKEEETRNKQREEIVEFLVRNNPFEVPKSLVDRQAVSMLNSMAERARRQNQKMPNLDDKFVEEVRSQAERRVRASMLLLEVAQKEKIEVDAARVQTRIDQIAQQLQKSPKETEQMLEAKEMLEDIRSEALTDQVFEFLIENAQKLKA